MKTKKKSPDAALDRPSLVKVVVDGMIEQTFEHIQSPEDAGLVSVTGELAGVAIDRVLTQFYPKAVALDAAMTNVFDAEWNEAWFGAREAAFLVGVEYGRRLAGGAK